MHLSIRRGLTIPIRGDLQVSDQTQKIENGVESKSIGLNLHSFGGKKGLRTLVQEGERVLLGQPLLEQKDDPFYKIVSPATGILKKWERGDRRALEGLIIDVDPLASPSSFSFEPLKPGQLTREKLLEEMALRGLLPHIRQRPFNCCIDRSKAPRSIFIKALESAPFVPSPDLLIQEYPELFQAGIDFLAQLTDGPLHLIHSLDSCAAISLAKNVTHHTVSGPHPRANLSLAIAAIDPITHNRDCIWTLSAWDLLVIGASLSQGRYFTEQIVAIAGEGVLESKRRLVRTQIGAHLGHLVENSLVADEIRLISGDPLMGVAKTIDDHLQFGHHCVTALPLAKKREFLHFLRLGLHKYSASGGYFSHSSQGKPFSFTTLLHGEERAFIDSAVYDRVMPLRVPTMHLVKAILAKDYEKAEELGLLEVDSEDFALATFVCPSKIEMVEIVREGLQAWSLLLFA